MTRTEFDAGQSALVCWSCKRTGALAIHPHPSDATHPGGTKCSACEAFQFWLSKEKNQGKRPTLPTKDRDAVWQRYGNACSHCGISAGDLAFIGVMRTVQHVPPFADVGDHAELLPYCEWCQQRSASEMKRIRSLLARLRKGPDAAG